jgi:outer membrane protein assembly factor BamB
MKHLRLKRLWARLVLLTGVLVAGGLVAAEHANAQNTFNQPGNILITDQFNNRVIEIDPAGNIVWQFGSGPGNTTPSSIIGTNDAERVGDLTLMSGTGIPAGVTTHCKKGCADNRVLLVDRRGNIVWQYGQFGVTGAGPNQLNTPVQNTYLPEPNGDDHILITDQGNSRIIEVRRSDKSIVWEYDGLNNPNAAELLTNGNILISDENNNQALEVTHTTPSTVVATFTTAGGMAFSGVAFASRLPSGHTLITDSNNSRIVETDASGKAFWQYFTNTGAGSNPSPLPTRAVQLANGNILISDQFNHRVIEVAHDAKGTIVASYGTINDPGFSPSTAIVMNGPYSANVIGDYTGITPPF